MLGRHHETASRSSLRSNMAHNIRTTIIRVPTTSGCATRAFLWRLHMSIHPSMRVIYTLTEDPWRLPSCPSTIQQRQDSLRDTGEGSTWNITHDHSSHMVVTVLRLDLAACRISRGSTAPSLPAWDWHRLQPPNPRYGRRVLYTLIVKNNNSTSQVVVFCLCPLIHTR